MNTYYFSVCGVGILQDFTVYVGSGSFARLQSSWSSTGKESASTWLWAGFSSSQVVRLGAPIPKCLLTGDLALCLPHGPLHKTGQSMTAAIIRVSRKWSWRGWTRWKPEFFVIQSWRWHLIISALFSFAKPSH